MNGLTVYCESIGVEQHSGELEVVLNGLNEDDVFEQIVDDISKFKIEEYIELNFEKVYETPEKIEMLLDLIGEDFCKEYYGIEDE